MTKIPCRVLAGRSWTIVGGNVEILPGFFDPIFLNGIATGDSLGAFAPDFFTIEFDDPLGVVQTPAIPVADAAFAAAFDPGGMSLNFYDANNVRFEIDANFTYTVVPESGMALLVGLGVMGIPSRFSRARIGQTAPSAGEAGHKSDWK